MPLKSTKTFKIESVAELKLASFKSELLKLADNKVPRWKFKVGLSVHTENRQRIWVGTVSCETEDIKEKMIDRVKKNRQLSPQWIDVSADDKFPGLTVLYTPPDGTEPEAK
jgi:hypothetical protein